MKRKPKRKPGPPPKPITVSTPEHGEHDHDYMDLPRPDLSKCSVSLGHRESGREPDVWHIEYGHFTAACDDDYLAMDLSTWPNESEDWLDVRFREDVCFQCRSIMAMTFDDESDVFVKHWLEVYQQNREKQEMREIRRMSYEASVAVGSMYGNIEKYNVEYRPRRNDARKKKKDEGEHGPD